LETDASRLVVRHKLGVKLSAEKEAASESLEIQPELYWRKH